MKTILSLIISATLVVSGYSQTRNVLVGTNNAVVQPTNFWSGDASNARSGLGLGTAATNPASAFQPSSATLSNLAAGNGGGLTNISATIVGTNISITNVVGLQSALDGKLATNGSAISLTSFPSVVLQTNSSLSLFPSGLLRTNGDGSGLTNLPVPASASNILSTVTIAKGGTGATNAEGARTALGGTVVGTNLFTAIDAAAARTAIGLGTASTSASTAFQPSSSALTNLAINNGGSLTNIVAGNIVGTVGLASNISGTVALASSVSGVLSVVNGGTGGTNAQAARNGIGIGTTNTLTIAEVVAQNLTIESGGGIALQSALSNAGSFRTNIGIPFVGLTSADAPTFRTALGLGTAATNPATAFQAASDNLAPLAANNGGALTNLQSTSIVGIIPASNISTVNFSNLGGTLTIASGGTGATNAVNARANLGSTTVGDALFIATNAASARTTIGATTVGSSVFTLANPSAVTFLRLNADNTASALSASDFRTALSLGTASTNPSSAFQPASTVLSNLASSNAVNLTNLRVTNIVGWSALTNTNAARSLIGFTTNNQVVTGPDFLQFTNEGVTFNVASVVSNLFLGDGSSLLFDGDASISLGTALTKSNFRNALQIGWPALTNTNAATSLLGLTTNNQIVANTTNVLTLTNGLAFSTNAVLITKTNLGIGNIRSNSIITVAGGSVDNDGDPMAGIGGNGGTINLDGGYRVEGVNGGNAGNVILQGGNGYDGISAGGNGGSIISFGAIGFPTGTGGTLNMSASSTSSGDYGFRGGNITTTGTAITNGGDINTSGGGSINTSGEGGGSIRMNGVGGGTISGSIDTRGLSENGGNIDTAGRAEAGGNIETWGNVASGGSINTSDGGGSIDLRAQGSIQFGTNGRRTTLTGTAIANRSISLPDASGTLALTNALGSWALTTNASTARTNLGIGWSALTNTNAANFRTDIGLGWSALTNSNAGTGLVSVNTNGVVVSPTNFWQVAPIQTLVQDLTVVVTTQTNNATNARNLYVYSLATNVSGISNTILLPTNAATFAGDEVTVIHQGTTNTTTVVRQAGSTNNLITLNRFDEAVKFIRESGRWDFYHNISHVEPIQFSGTNASNNIAATRTNLSLGLPALTNSDTTNFQAAVFQTNTTPAGAAFNNVVAWMEVNVFTNGSNTSFRIPLFK